MHDFQEGDSASLTQPITEEDIALFARISGDTNPVHLDARYAAGTRFGRRIAHGMLTASRISAVLGTRLPGPGSIYLGQSLRFLAPVYVGDTITASVGLTTYDRERGRMTLETRCTNQHGAVVLTGEALVLYRGEGGTGSGGGR